MDESHSELSTVFNDISFVVSFLLRKKGIGSEMRREFKDTAKSALAVSLSPLALSLFLAYS